MVVSIFYENKVERFLSVISLWSNETPITQDCP